LMNPVTFFFGAISFPLFSFYQSCGD